MTNPQEADNSTEASISQLIVSAQMAVASLTEYREEDRTYRVDAKSMIDIISALESLNKMSTA
jgi:hypothetical protein